MDRRLSPEQEALSVMMSHFIENSVYYGLFYHRWIQPQVLLSLPESSRWCCEACIWTGNAQKCSSGAPLLAAGKLMSTMQESRSLAVSLCHPAGLRVHQGAFAGKGARCCRASGPVHCRLQDPAPHEKRIALPGQTPISPALNSARKRWSVAITTQDTAVHMLRRYSRACLLSCASQIL